MQASKEASSRLRRDLTTIDKDAGPPLMWCNGPAAAALIFLAPVAAGAADGSGTVTHPCLEEKHRPIEVVPAEPVGTFLDAEGSRYTVTDLVLQDGAAVSSGNAWFQAIAIGPEDRWGDRPAWVFVNGGEPMMLLQEWLLSKGRGLFYPERSTGDCAARLRKAERAGERSMSGVWSGNVSSPVFDTRAPESLAEKEGQFVIARGPIVSLGKTPRTRYLNFGSYWKADVTATISSADDEAFAGSLAFQGTSFEDLEGRSVEIRGFVTWRDGPLFELSHPGQLWLMEE